VIKLSPIHFRELYSKKAHIGFEPFRATAYSSNYAVSTVDERNPAPLQMFKTM